jgi:hypothetical protein
MQQDVISSTDSECREIEKMERRHLIRLEKTLVAILAGLLFISTEASGDKFYVSPAGDDKWSGKLPAASTDHSDGPLATLKRASDIAKPGDTCFIRKGIYRQTLRPARSGKPAQTITFMNYENERAIISGADRVTGWRQGESGVCTASVAWDMKDRNQAFSDGNILTEARWPDISGTVMKPLRAHAQAGTIDTLTDPKLTGPNDAWKGALLWCAGGKEWICWSARVTGYNAKTHTLTFTPKQPNRWYQPTKGNPYVLMGVQRALNSAGEWRMDGASKTLHLRPPDGKNPKTLDIEFKRRLHAIDLSGRSHIRVIGLEFRSAGIRTDTSSSDIVLRGLRGNRVAHSYEKDITGKSGVLIHGRRIEVTDCQFAFSSGSVVDVRGSDNRLVNCYIHSGNYGAKWRGTLAVTGRRHVIAYNTIRHSGRDLVNVHGLSESLIEYNDLSDAGWLTSDLGMIYGHNTDFANTEIRYNLVHDNHAPACNMGIYFDHLSHNVIVHHNVVWNVRRDPIRINNPSYNNLVYHNTCWNTGPITTFDHSRRNDLFGTRYNNNILNAPIRLPEHAAVTHNIVAKTPSLIDPDQRNFALKSDSKARNAGMVIEGMGSDDGKPDIGALEFGRTLWKAGHDFSRPTPTTSQLKRPAIGYMNIVKNACFELPALESWTPIGAKKAKLTKGNGWGAKSVSGKTYPTGTSKFELRLGGGNDGVEQVVTGLHPRRRYTLSAWMRVANSGESVSLGVRGFGSKEASTATSSIAWIRKTVSFETGPSVRSVIISLKKTSPGGGYAWCDNVAIPLVAPVRAIR